MFQRKLKTRRIDKRISRRVHLVWRKVNGSSTKDEALLSGWSEFKCVLVGNRVFCLGGYRNVVVSPTRVCWLDIAEKLWHTGVALGDNPSSILGNPFVLIGDCLWSMGNAGRINTLDVCALDLPLLSWKKVKLRENYVVVAGQPVVDFCEQKRAVLVNCVSMLSTQGQNTTLILKVDGGVIQKLNTKGKGPTLRVMQSSSFSESLERWFIVGGRRARSDGTPLSSQLNDLFILNFREPGLPTWTELTLLPQVQGISNTSLHILGKRVLLLGGERGQRRPSYLSFRYDAESGELWFETLKTSYVYSQGFSREFDTVQGTQNVVFGSGKLYKIMQLQGYGWRDFSYFVGQINEKM